MTRPDQLDAVLRSWLGTRYLSGVGVKGQYADCYHFVAGVLDELFGRTDPLPRVPHDTGLWDRRKAVRVVSMLARRYPHTIVRDGSRRPGDVLVARRGKGPGHVYIVGPDMAAWHCAQPERGVCKVVLSSQVKVLRVYRFESLWQ